MTIITAVVAAIVSGSCFRAGSDEEMQRISNLRPGERLWPDTDPPLIRASFDLSRYSRMLLGEVIP